MKINHGFLLTAHSKDVNGKVELSFYGKSPNGPFKLTIHNEPIVFFILSEQEFSPKNFKFTRKPLPLKNFKGTNVDGIYINSLAEFQKAKDFLKENKILSYEIDIRPEERYLMERYIKGDVEILGDSTIQNGIIHFSNPKIRKGQCEIELSKLSLDIETGTNGELYSIGLYYNHQLETKSVVLMGSKKQEINTPNIKFFSHEKEILISFFDYLNNWDPDIITGWHVIGFDFEFIEKKCQKYGLDFNVGRSNQYSRIKRNQTGSFHLSTEGRIILDGPPLLRSAFYKFKNFKLDTVAQNILGLNKDISGDTGKVDEIERRYREDKESLAKYNILDCKLVHDIFEKLNLYNFVMNRVRISGLLIDRLNISTAAFDYAFLPPLHRKGIVAPNKIEFERDEQSTGGLVIEPKIGRHKNIAVLDFKSLYPTIIKTFNIDPYSRLILEKETITTPCGVSFSKENGILPTIISELMVKREKAKLNSDQSLSQAIKILMNSFYGVMGSMRSRFYHADIPRAITTTGHYILKNSIEFLEREGLKTIYGDTDSLFISLPENSESQGSKLAQKLNTHLSELLMKEFSATSFLECEFEKIYEQMYFPKSRHNEAGAKKRYVGLYQNQLEFKGMEFVRSDWTELAKNFQKQLYEKFLNNEEVEGFIKSYIKNLEMGFFDQELIYTKKLSKAPEEYTKNIPIHVKAALKINHNGPYRLKEVSYIITKKGPEPVQHNPSDIDYQHYIEKQIGPIANDILLDLNSSFEGLMGGEQLNLI